MTDIGLTDEDRERMAAFAGSRDPSDLTDGHVRGGSTGTPETPLTPAAREAAEYLTDRLDLGDRLTTTASRLAEDMSVTPAGMGQRLGTLSRRDCALAVERRPRNGRPTQWVIERPEAES